MMIIWGLKIYYLKAKYTFRKKHYLQFTDFNVIFRL